MISRPLILIAWAALLVGCVSDEPQKKLGPQPANVQPSRLGVWATLPEDTDSNGYLDTVDVTVYVSSDAYAAPIAVPGSFEFKLIGKSGKDLAKWDIPEAKAAQAMRRMGVGPGYIFRLSVLEAGNDRVEAQAVNLAAEFRPKTGEPVHAPLTALQFGKIRK
jgi:hypothetical protein